MKIKLQIAFVFIFLVIGKAKAQQCLTGGCTNSVSQYPTSGAPFTPSTSWQVLKNGANDALMNAGNYTLFNVIVGSTYEWSYCENLVLGAVSTSWDAQLTLTNNANPTTPICFSTDVCGTNGNAPYLSWVATFTGTVRLLTTAYVSGTGGCQTNSGSPYNKLAYRKVGSGNNLTITVHNVGGAVINNAKVILYNSSWSPLQTLFTNASGQVFFSGLSSANYNFEVYFTPSGTSSPIAPNEEFWGSGMANISGSNLSVSFTRNQPYISSPIPFSPSTINTGQQTTGGYTVLNPLPFSTNSYVRIWVDRDQISGWDYSNQASPQSINAGGTLPFSFNVTPSISGSYFKYAFVYSLVNGNYIITDQYAWSTSFTANSACITPGTPASAVGTSTGQTSANLSWTAGNPIGSPAITYYWVVGTNSSVTYGNGVDFGTTTGTSASTSALACGTTYYLRVYAQTSCDGSNSVYRTSSSFTTSNCTSQLLGIDVSHWQSIIDWPQVYGAGKIFAYVKATEGASNYGHISYFNTNIVEAEAAGLITGAYHYAKPNLNSAVSEANYFLSIAASHIGKNHLPPALDIENPDAAAFVANNSITALESWLQTWMTTVQNATGVPPIIYVPATISPFTSFSNSLSASQLWIVNQNGNTNPPLSTGVFNTWVIKQYAGAPLMPGTCPGINGNVDLDVFNGSISAFNNLINISGASADLTITAGTQQISSQTVAAGSSVTASAAQDNGGNAVASTGTSVTLWLSSSTNLNTSTATNLGEITGYQSISQNSNSPVFNATVNIPCSTPPGSYYLFFWADGGTCSSGTNCTTCHGIVNESDECNNFVFLPIAITTNTLSALITPSGTTTFCQGGSIILNANTGAGLSYQWKKNGTNISGATLSSYQATTSGSYAVQVTNTCGSSTSSAIVVTVNALPVASITPSGNLSFCTGAGINLQANTGAGLTYQWRKNSQNIVGATSAGYLANSTGSFNVVVTKNGCSKGATPVNITSPPSNTVTAGGVTHFCNGGSVALSSLSGQSVTYQWRKNGANISGATSSTYVATATGSYNCVVTNNVGCSKGGIAISITGPPSAVISANGSTSFCVGQSVTLSAQTGYTYQWLRNSANIPNAIQQNYIATTAGNYKVIVTDQFNCSKTTPNTNQITVVVPCRIGESNLANNDLLASQSIKLFPNPTDGILNFELISQKPEVILVKILNAIGEVVYKSDIQIIEGYNINEIDLSKFTTGIYFVDVKTDTQTFRQKIIKE